MSKSLEFIGTHLITKEINDTRGVNPVLSRILIGVSVQPIGFVVVSQSVDSS